jgi:hypothetical protein
MCGMTWQAERAAMLEELDMHEHMFEADGDHDHHGDNGEYGGLMIEDGANGMLPPGVRASAPSSPALSHARMVSQGCTACLHPWTASRGACRPRAPHACKNAHHNGISVRACLRRQWWAISRVGDAGVLRVCLEQGACISIESGSTCSKEGYTVQLGCAGTRLCLPLQACSSARRVCACVRAWSVSVSVSVSVSMSVFVSYKCS